jgi:hypothetical protein
LSYRVATRRQFVESVEEPLDLVSPFVLGFVVRDRVAPVALCRDNGLDVGAGDLFANGVGIITLIGKERLDPVGNHPEQWRKALDVMRLPGRQDEAERAAFRIAPGMELGGEAAARSTISASVSSIASNTPVSTQRL